MLSASYKMYADLYTFKLMDLYTFKLMVRSRKEKYALV